MNVFCLGGKVIGSALVWELIETFLAARVSNAPRHQRRLAKVQTLENQNFELEGLSHEKKASREAGRHRMSLPQSDARLKREIPDQCL
jgi:hypothetical protein